MVPSAGEVQRIGRPQTELRPDRSGLVIDFAGHVEGLEQPEQRFVRLPQDRITPPERPDQTFEFNQRRNREPGRSRIGEDGSHPLRPDRMALHQINEQAGVEIDQSQDDRSRSISASISAPERCA